MIIPSKFMVIYPLLAFQPNQILEPTNNFVPYQTYTTTNMMQDQDLKVYERFWGNIIKEGCDSNSMAEWKISNLYVEGSSPFCRLWIHH